VPLDVASLLPLLLLPLPPPLLLLPLLPPLLLPLPLPLPLPPPLLLPLPSLPVRCNRGFPQRTLRDRSRADAASIFG